MIENYKDYLSSIDTIKKEVYMNPVEYFMENPFVSIKSETDMFFTNLNYHNILLKSPKFIKDHDFHKDVMFYELINHLDTKCDYQLFINSLINIQNKECIPKTSLFCSFHYGAYIQIPTILKMLNIDFVVVTMAIDANGVINWQSKNEKKSLDKSEIIQPTTINPQDKESVFKIYKSLKKGVSVLLYLDGIQGRMSQQDKRNTVVNFFNQQLVFSTSITKISQKLQIPILPVIAYRTEDYTINAVFHNLNIDNLFDSEDYCHNSIQETIDIFQKYLKNEPAQWQEWTNIHHNLIYNKPTEKSKFSLFKLIKNNFKTSYPTNSILDFNYEEFEIVFINLENYIICIDNYVSFKITDNLKQILLSLNKLNLTKRQIISIIPPTLLNDLLQNRIVIPKGITKIQ